MTFGEKIKEARKSKNLTLEDLSKVSGLSLTILSQLERDHHIPSALSIKKLSEALEIDYDELWELSNR